MIKRLTENLTEDLCAQQVITSLPDCIKELIDNAIDAKSTKIRVHLDDYGKRSIVVSDNGTGIENFDCLGKVDIYQCRKDQLLKTRKMQSLSKLWDSEDRLYIPLLR